MGKKKKRDSRIKRTHKFQLNINKGAELWLHEWIPVLTLQRKFSQYVRDGLSLMIHFAEWGITAQSVYDLFIELRAGKIDKLIVMFPHLRERLTGQVTAPAPETPPSASIKALQDQVEQLTQIILQQRLPDELHAAKAQPITGKQLGVGKVIAAPTFVDDDLTVEFVEKEIDGMVFTKNLIGSAMGLIGKH